MRNSINCRDSGWLFDHYRKIKDMNSMRNRNSAKYTNKF